jgi:hypothetical protein
MARLAARAGRRLTLAALVTTLVLAAAASAGARGLAVVDGAFTYTASPGENNCVSFTFRQYTNESGPLDVLEMVDSCHYGDDHPLADFSPTLDYRCGEFTYRDFFSGAVLYTQIRCPLAGDPDDPNDDITSLSIDSGDQADGINIFLFDASAAALPTTVMLGAGADYFGGGAEPDTVDAGPGDDVLVMSAGADNLSGGEGFDELRLGSDAGGTMQLGSAGNGADGWNTTLSADFEHLIGGAGPDVIAGAGVDTLIEGGDGSDTLTGGSRADVLYGGDGDDVLAGGTGNDELDGGGGADALDGGSGDDVVYGSYGDDELTGGAGSDHLNGEADNDGLAARDGEVDTVDCGEGADHVTVDFQPRDPVDDAVNPDCELSGVAITSAPPALSGVATATFEFVLPDAPPGNFECRLDGGAFAQCISGVHYSGLQDGAHSFTVHYVPVGDSAGPDTTYNWTVDTAVPVVVVDSAPSGTIAAQAATISFHSSKPDGASFTCTLDLEPAYACSSPQKLLALTDGPHTFTITTTDAVGHTSAPVTLSWSVNTSAAPDGGGGGDGGGSSGGGTPTPTAACPSGRRESVEFGVVKARAREPAGCFEQTTVDGRSVLAARGRISVNGIHMTPSPGTLIVVDGSLANGTVKTTGPSTLALDRIAIHVPSGFEWSSANTSATSKLFQILGTAFGNGSPGKALAEQGFEYVGLPFSAAPSFELSGDNGGQAKVTLKLELPGRVIRTLPGGQTDKGPTFEVGLVVANGAAARYTGKAKIAEAWLFGKLKLKSLELAVDSSGPTIEGGASLELTNGSELRTTVQLGPDGLAGTSVRKVGLEVSKLNTPIPSTPLYLQKFGGQFAAKGGGFEIKATAGLSAGKQFDLSPIFKGAAVSVNGEVAFTVPDSDQPWSFQAKGDANVVEFKVAEGSAKYVHGQRVEFGGKFDLSVGGKGVLVEIKPQESWITADSFSFQGHGSVNLFGFERKLDMVVSDHGAAACWGPPDERIGFTKVWGQQVEPVGGNAGCDAGLATIVVAARAAQLPGERRLTVKPSTRFQIVTVQGVDAPPALSLTGPRGFSLAVPAGEEPLSQKGVEVMKDPAARATIVVLRHPVPGVYTLVPVDPAQVASVETAVDLPPVDVHASVTGARTARTLRWRLRRIPGQRVEFAERGPAGARVIATTAAAHGRRAFRPDPLAGRGRREIHALVSQYGLPRRDLVVASYVYDPGRVRSVTGLRLRGARLSWRGQAAAVSYVVALESAGGTTLSRTTAKPALVLPNALLRRPLTARVVTLDATGRASRPASKRFTPKRKRRSIR